MNPPPTSIAVGFSVAQLKALLDDPDQIAGRDYLVVDVRRTDMDEEPGNVTIPHAINVPAQTFYQTVSTLCEVWKRIPLVIFHCSSSNGRGPRCAGWFADELKKRNWTSTQALVLTGGIKAWCNEYPNTLQRL